MNIGTVDAGGEVLGPLTVVGMSKSEGANELADRDRDSVNRPWGPGASRDGPASHSRNLSTPGVVNVLSLLSSKTDLPPCPLFLLTSGRTLKALLRLRSGRT